MTTTATRHSEPKHADVASGTPGFTSTATPPTIASSHAWYGDAPRLAGSATAVRIARSLVLAAARRSRGGTLLITEGDGSEPAVYGDGDPVVRLTIHDPRAYLAFAQRQSVGLAEAYGSGWWDADDVTAFVRLLSRRTAVAIEALGRYARATRGRDVFARRAPGRRSDRRNIQAHYDVSNDFYELMLDPTMTYSCALFDADARKGRTGTAPLTLEQAQTAKIARICDKLALSPEDHLIEIGTGWGGFAMHAARNYGCRVTTTTISDAQRRFAEKRVAEAGLADRIEILDKDWRDLEGTYSRLVSVEMIEAVDWRNQAAFLRKCSDLLAHDGLGVIQAIIIEGEDFDRQKHRDDFIRTMIFPASCLPSVASLANDLVGSGLTLVGLEDIGANYAQTLNNWRSNLADNSEKVAKLGMADEFHRIWYLYLCYCEAAFLELHITDVQLKLAKPGWKLPAGHGNDD
jgi:cyclopropane-fatty-acyl-phospholipid synthase